jgi:hypothetical protein
MRNVFSLEVCFCFPYVHKKNEHACIFKPEIYSFVFVFLSCIARAERAPTICMLILDCAPRDKQHMYSTN